MQDILGQTFSVGDGEYRIVDVQKLSGEVMVYAEDTRAQDQAHRPTRAAFHYGDIASRLQLNDRSA